MDDKTLGALQQSIAKWEANAKHHDAGDVRISSDACPLCAIFMRKDCEGCPVKARSGRSICEGTPYVQASVTYWSWKYGSGSRLAFQRDARAEVEFLKSLLPVPA